MFEHRLGAVPRSGVDFTALAERTEGYSGADIAQICERAKLSRAVKAASGGRAEVDGSDIEEAMKASAPTVSRQDLEDMERYRLTGEGPLRGAERDVYVPRNPAKGYRDAGYQ